MSSPQELSGRLMAAVLSVGIATLLVALLAFSSSAHAETCPNETLRAEAHSTKLPDCRAYELVSPPFTEAAAVSLHGSAFLGSFTGMSVDGSHVAMDSVGDFGDAQGPLESNDYDVTRTASGWKETDVDIPVSRFPAGEVAAQEEYEALHGNATEPFASTPLQASSDFSKILYQTPHDDSSEWPGSFWIVEADGALHHIGPAKGKYIEASPNPANILFESGGSYELGALVGGTLEEEQYVPGQEVAASPVGVEPDGKACAAKVPAVRSFEEPHRKRVISADGSTVFFTCSGELFARLDQSRTVAISEPSTADCSACDTSPGVQVPAERIDGASADGSKVFFTTTQSLLGSQTETSANIYEYDFDLPQASPADPDGRIVQVTAGNWGSGGVQVTGVVGVSEDGSHVYFTASGVLAGAENSQGKPPQPGGANQYVYDAETGLTAFIATGGITGLGSNPHPNITPDGRFLVFASTADLTPDDTSKAQQVFEYDAENGELVRVSVGQDGYNDNGNTDSFGAEIPLGSPGEPVAVSSNGEYVAFESPDGLTPGALNGDFQETVGESYYVENVYEYHDGNVYLISDGQDTGYGPRHPGEGSAVELDGMSPSGDDIFFDTTDQLVPQALSTGVAVYDAHIDGGFAAPVSLLPTCSGDACQGSLSPAPVLLSPGSEFQAPGNALAPSAPPPAAKPKPKAKAKTCKKGTVRKKGSRTCTKTKPKKKTKIAKKASHNGRDK